MSKMKPFERLDRVAWVLASDGGSVLAHGHPDSRMPPYRLDPLTDSLPAIVSAPNKYTLRDIRLTWNATVRRMFKGNVGGLLVREHKVRITIQEEGAK